jgi:hypothetical protein
MSGGLLHVFELRTFFERRDAHRVRRVAAIEPEHGGISPHHAIDRVGVHAPAFLLPLAILLQGPKHSGPSLSPA